MDLKNFFGKVTISEMAASLVAVILGLIIALVSNIGLNAATLFIGLIAIIFGVIEIVSFLFRSDLTMYNYSLILGLASIVLGILFFAIKIYLIMLLGIYLIVQGLGKMYSGLYIKKYNDISWIITLIVGVLFIAIGVVCFFEMRTTANATIVSSGIALAGYGLINIIHLFLLRRRCDNFIM